MQFFRTLCVVAVLGALSYGAYITLTQSPPVEPPLDAVNWDSPPRIELPMGDSLNSSKSSQAATKTGTTIKPTGNASSVGDPHTAGSGAAKLGTPHDSTGAPMTATITGVRAQTTTSVPPASYPTTNAAPTAFDAAGATPLTNITLGPALPSAITPASGASTTSPTGPTLGSPGTTTSPSAASATPQPVSTVANVSGAPPTASTIPTAPTIASAPTTNPASGSASPSGIDSAAATATVPFEQAQSLLQQNKPAAALDLLSDWFDNPQLSPADDARVMQLLDELAGRVVYSAEPWLEPAYVVQPGDRIDQIAAKYKISWELLAKINGLNDPWNLQPGSSLKVVRGPFNALVDKSRRRLSLFVGDGLYAASFAVGFGRDQGATDGSYVVQNKVSGPLRVIDLGNNIALHTQNDSLPLSSDDAPGCIRLSARDAEDLYDILGPGSQVIIRP